MNSEYALQALGICKSFGPVQVLKEVDFSLLKGEVHGLMGENGAGKSTLIKILTGVYEKDAGEILVAGEHVEIHSRKDAGNCGISVIYQELSVIESLTVAQNIFLGQEKEHGVFLADREMNEEAQKLIEKYHFELKPSELVGTLSIAKQQTVEILKAVSANADVIIMDEPTASLTSKECKTLFSIIQHLRDEGKAIIYISHRLDEIDMLVDRLTVLRNGELVGVRKNSETNPFEIIQMMLGKELVNGQKVYHEPIENGNRLEVKELSIGGVLRKVSFTAEGGQILGIGGLVGAGRTEILKSIFGLLHYDGGEIRLNGKPVSKRPGKNVQNGIGYVPEDRRSEGIVPLMSIAENIILACFDQLSLRSLLMKNREAKKAAWKSIEDMDIRPQLPSLNAINLSGGNQQKVVIGKWLMRNNLKVLLVDEPTVGIDVGAKAQIYACLDKLAAQGIVVIVVSSDLEELITVSDRILVMYRGKVFQEFGGMEITRENILAAASGISKESL